MNYYGLEEAVRQYQYMQSGNGVMAIQNLKWEILHVYNL